MVQVITYGWGHDLWRLLNGIVIFLGGNEFSGLIFTVAVMAVASGVLFVRRINPFSYFMAVWMPALIYVALFTSTTSIMITDQMYGNGAPAGNWSVDHVPLGLAYPLSILTRVEDLIIQAIDNNFSPVNHTYRRFGLLGEISLIQALDSNNYLEDPYMYQTTLAYINDCVLPAFASGDIDPLAFKYSPDLLASIAVNYQALFTKVYSAGNPQGQVVTCAAAYAALSGQVNAAAMSLAPNSAVDRLANKTGFSRLYRTPAEVATMLNDVGVAYFNGAQTGADMLKQSYMISVMRGMTGVPALTPATASARQNFITAVATTTQIYIEMLPTLNAIIHLVIILLFPLVGMFFVLQNGKPFLAWLFGMAWVGLWQPIQALVQTLMAGYLAQSVNSLTAITGGFSLGNMWMIATKTGHSFVVAGLILMATPTIAAMILSWMGVRTTSMLFAAESLRGNLRWSGSRGASDAFDPRAAKGLGNTISEQDYLAAASLKAANPFSDRAFRQWRSWYTDPWGGAYGQRRGSVKSDFALPNISNMYRASDGKYVWEYGYNTKTGREELFSVKEVGTGRDIVTASVSSNVGVSSSHGLTGSESTSLARSSSHATANNLARSKSHSIGAGFTQTAKDGHSEQIRSKTQRGIVYSEKVDSGLGDSHRESRKKSESLMYTHEGTNRDQISIRGSVSGKAGVGGGKSGGIYVGVGGDVLLGRTRDSIISDTTSTTEKIGKEKLDETSTKSGISAIVGTSGGVGEDYSNADSVSEGKSADKLDKTNVIVVGGQANHAESMASAAHNKSTTAQKTDTESQRKDVQTAYALTQVVMHDPEVQKTFNDWYSRTSGQGSFQPVVDKIREIAAKYKAAYHEKNYSVMQSRARGAFESVR
ncbi:MAG TPA: conjugal transfer protein TraG, partial [Deltaproteobacteria bacterium]|nr:conjugal transfer protein TraG [Deltaproteobacteria bacterium]